MPHRVGHLLVHIEQLIKILLVHGIMKFTKYVIELLVLKVTRRDKGVDERRKPVNEQKNSTVSPTFYFNG